MSECSSVSHTLNLLLCLLTASGKVSIIIVVVVVVVDVVELLR